MLRLRPFMLAAFAAVSFALSGQPTVVVRACVVLRKALGRFADLDPRTHACAVVLLALLVAPMWSVL